MKKKKDPTEQFLALSAVLTGFERVDLLGTGLTEQYYQKLAAVVGQDICDVDSVAYPARSSKSRAMTKRN